MAAGVAARAAAAGAAAARVPVAVEIGVVVIRAGAVVPPKNKAIPPPEITLLSLVTAFLLRRVQLIPSADHAKNALPPVMATK